MELKRVVWNPGHARELIAALAGDPLASVAEFERWVSEETAVLFDVLDEGRRLGCVLIAADMANGHNQGVIVAGASENGITVKQLRAALKAVVERMHRFDSIRTHIRRPALVRLYRSLGFEQAEIVMRKSNG